MTTTDPVAPATEPVTELRIERVDPFDVAGVEAWVDVTTAALAHEVGDHTTMWTAPEMLVPLQHPPKSRHELIFNGTVDGELVATGWITLPQIDNLVQADLYVAVLPAHRRRGHGTAMLDFLEQVCRDHGRSRFTGLADWAYDGPVDGRGTPGLEFALARGFSFALGDVQRELPLPADGAVLAELAAEAAPHHDGYELRSWAGPVPEELVVDYVALDSSLATEAPTGDLETEAHTADVEAHRTAERVMAAQGRATWHTVALDRAGHVVAYTLLVVPAHDPKWVFQWGTLVHRAHRGHRLGLAVKVANLRAVQASAQVAARRVVTWNADVNDHMIGINERMGFRPTARAASVQKKL